MVLANRQLGEGNPAIQQESEQQRRQGCAQHHEHREQAPDLPDPTHPVHFGEDGIF